MKMPQTTPINNKQSELLNTDENLLVFKLLGHGCQTMATAVVQLFVTQPPAHNEWLLRNSGVLCFVKDNNQKSFFFRLYCLKTNQLVWQHEMYNEMEYKELISYLHCFEGDQCIVGFHFASTNEAYQFYQVVKTRIETRRRKREERKSRSLSSQSMKLVPTNNNNLAPKMINYNPDMYKKSPNPEAKLIKRKRNVTKADISTPTNFQHIQHVGWNADTGFDINTNDENLKKFFKQVGVLDSHLEDPVLKDFIYDFVDRHKETIIGAKNGVSSIHDNAPPPAVPPRGPTHNKNTNRAAPPPPPVGGPPRVVRTPSNRPYPAEAPKKPRPPSPPKLSGGGYAPSSAPAPPPPPPPPPMDFAAPPPPPIPTGGSPPFMGPRMDPSNLRPASPVAPPAENPRNNLLQEIEKGVTLKRVGDREIKPPSSPSPIKEDLNSNDLAMVLQRQFREFLKKRQDVLNQSDDDSGGSDSNEDEWD